MSKLAINKHKDLILEITHYLNDFEGGSDSLTKFNNTLSKSKSDPVVNAQLDDWLSNILTSETPRTRAIFRNSNASDHLKDFNETKKISGAATHLWNVKFGYKKPYTNINF
ncbi:hypothetical protein OAA_13805 [Vibrio cyclitrophicus 1F175]|uniref:hypothetical protein n=1 Tax=Vibrio cyclitrophicus TaxID=47951 RepID=UPI00035D14B5|nr:hypothetical protein [Vibrio cyclitrophicus]OEF63556.1 hypothetical protein OAA_13805 [Vibrio cyclitrophicus 1F175]